MSRGLKGNVLRGFADHRSQIGRAYTELYRDKQAELGVLPKSARPLLREWARVVLDLERTALDLEKPSIRKQATMSRRLRREQKVLRFTLLKLEQRLAGLASENHDPQALERALRAMP